MRYQPTMVGRARRSLRFFSASLLWMLAAAGCQAPARAPDVLLLLVDTLRADHLGVYGYTRDTSPALDALAASSTVFRDVVATASWTLPSVGSALTGTYPSVHGLRAQKGANAVTTLRSGVATLAEAFEANGYRTVAIVTNPWVIAPAHGLRRGFTDFRDAHRSTADRVNEMAREVLAEAPGPVFLYLHYMDVHGPYNRRNLEPVAEMGAIPGAYRRKLTPQEHETLPGYIRLAGVGRLGGYLDAYDRGIRSWDEDLGKLVDWLRETGRLEHTVISVVADHGEEFLEHGGWDHGATLYQEQVAVPWILYRPGFGRDARNEVVSLVDVGPTLLGAVGIPVPATMTGRNALAAPPATPRSVFSEHAERRAGDAARVAVRRGDTKLIFDPNGEQCFDLSTDPGEHSPLPTGTRCDEQAVRDLERWRRDTQESVARLGTTGTDTLSTSERERLRKLGYAE